LDDRVYITSQNHGYAVESGALPPEWRMWFTNENDGSNEGIRHLSRPWRSVQFHPEAAPGPTDTAWIFDDFIDDVMRRV
jgi:carbamoyl-phosphate synthase small subunit